MGADKIGNHGSGEGGMVIRKSCDAQEYSELDGMWVLAGTKTQN